MAEVLEFSDGGYRFIRGVFQYSAGVAALPGFEIERARFFRPLPLAAGFAAIEAHLKSRGRAPSALCACELRSPAPVSDAGFGQFNAHYVDQLDAWQSGTTYPFPFTAAAVEAATKDHLVLKPA